MSKVSEIENPNPYKRPIYEDGTFDPPTGWCVYYCWGRGGGGIDKPRYVYAPWAMEYAKADHDGLAEEFVYAYEQWILTAEQGNLDVFVNVMPPKASIERAHRDAESLMITSWKNTKTLKAQLENYPNESDLHPL